MSHAEQLLDDPTLAVIEIFQLDLVMRLNRDWEAKVPSGRGPAAARHRRVLRYAENSLKVLPCKLGTFAAGPVDRQQLVGLYGKKRFARNGVADQLSDCLLNYPAASTIKVRPSNVPARDWRCRGSQVSEGSTKLHSALLSDSRNRHQVCVGE
jgi:hypothetical protein